MATHVRSVLSLDELKRVRELLKAAEWEDGRATASGQAANVKRNLQVAMRGASRKPLDEIIMPAIERSEIFAQAAFPKKMAPPTYNRCDAAMTYGSHVDAAFFHKGRLRADLSFTLFIWYPANYDGGDRILESVSGRFGTNFRPAT